MAGLGLLILYIVIICIVVWGVNQLRIPEPFNFVKVIIYCVLAIWLAIAAYRVLGSGFPALG